MASEELQQLKEINRAFSDLLIVRRGEKRVYRDAETGHENVWWVAHSDNDGQLGVAECETLEFEEHHHDSNEIIIVRRGNMEVRYTDTGELVNLRANGDCEALLHCIPAGRPHIVRYMEDTKLYVALIPRGSGL